MFANPRMQLVETAASNCRGLLATYFGDAGALGSW
jgi:hypothetical protein